MNFQRALPFFLVFLSLNLMSCGSDPDKTVSDSSFNQQPGTNNTNTSPDPVSSASSSVLRFGDLTSIENPGFENIFSNPLETNALLFGSVQLACDGYLVAQLQYRRSPESDWHLIQELFVGANFVDVNGRIDGSKRIGENRLFHFTLALAPDAEVRVLRTEKPATPDDCYEQIDVIPPTGQPARGYYTHQNWNLQALE